MASKPLHVALWLLREAQGIIRAGVLRLWAKCQYADPVALKGTGIRVVVIAVSDQIDRAWRLDVRKALQLLRKYSPRHARRVMKHIAVVLVRSRGNDGVYISPGRICILNLSRFSPDWSAKTRQIAIAGLLVHEATHGRIDRRRAPCSRDSDKRFEQTCVTEQTRVVERLARCL